MFSDLCADLVRAVSTGDACHRLVLSKGEQGELYDVLTEELQADLLSVRVSPDGLEVTVLKEEDRRPLRN
jgi:hypothetical protein